MLTAHFESDAIAPPPSLLLLLPPPALLLPPTGGGLMITLKAIKSATSCRPPLSPPDSGREEDAAKLPLPSRLNIECRGGGDDE